MHIYRIIENKYLFQEAAHLKVTSAHPRTDNRRSSSGDKRTSQDDKLTSLTKRRIFEIFSIIPYLHEPMGALCFEKTKEIPVGSRYNK